MHVDLSCSETGVQPQQGSVTVTGGGDLSCSETGVQPQLAAGADDLRANLSCSETGVQPQPVCCSYIQSRDLSCSETGVQPQRWPIRQNGGGYLSCSETGVQPQPTCRGTTQHCLQRHRRTATFRPGLGVMRCNQPQQPTPRHHRIHLRQNQLPPRLLFLHRVAQAGKGGLFRRRQAFSWGCPDLSDQTESGRFFRGSFEKA